MFLGKLTRAEHLLPNTNTHSGLQTRLEPCYHALYKSQHRSSSIGQLPSHHSLCLFSPSSGGLQAQLGPLMPLPPTQHRLLSPSPFLSSTPAVSLLTEGLFEVLGAWYGASGSPVAQPPAGTQMDTISRVRGLAEGSLLETWENQGLTPRAGHTSAMPRTSCYTMSSG